MTNMKPMTYEDFTNLNIAGNLTDFIFYLQDRNVVQLAPHINKFSNDIQSVVNEMLQDWLEVAKEELKERNEYLALNNTK